MSALRIAALAALAIALLVNAVIHLTLATPFDAVAGAIASQGDLFRIQAVANIAIVAIVAFARRAWADAAAIAIALGGAGLIVVTALVPLDLTGIGLPYLFEPAYYADKTIALIAQLVAAVAAGALLVIDRRRLRAASSAAPATTAGAGGATP